jgi:hypothetical protein
VENGLAAASITADRGCNGAGIPLEQAPVKAAQRRMRPWVWLFHDGGAKAAQYCFPWAEGAADADDCQSRLTLGLPYRTQQYNFRQN